MTSSVPPRRYGASWSSSPIPSNTQSHNYKSVLCLVLTVTQSMSEISFVPTPVKPITRYLVYGRCIRPLPSRYVRQGLGGMYIIPDRSMFRWNGAIMQHECLCRISANRMVFTAELWILTRVTSLLYPNNRPPVSMRIKSALPSARSLPLPWGRAAFSTADEINKSALAGICNLNVRFL
jgi:hypothetical protein